jgi:hypothetical protein
LNMSNSKGKAYVDTTVLADALLKPSSPKQARALAALARYEETLLPVYSIKELKAGALGHYAWLHDKFVQTRSLADTVQAISSINPYYQPGRKSTALEALAAATQLLVGGSESAGDYASRDSEDADRYRLALAKLIVLSWKKRRKLAHKTIQELDCYIEAAPRRDKTSGFFDLSPQYCSGEKRCSREKELKAPQAKDLLVALRNAIPESSSRAEDRNRRSVLSQLIRQPQKHINEEECRWLGDAMFAFFCPRDAVILTTNTRDHVPLAEAISKRAEKP